MIAPACQHANKAKHGKDRHGNQRWKCKHCGTTLTSNEERPLGDMRIDNDRAVFILTLLLEGMSIRAAERITKVARKTICDLILTVGDKCDAFLQRTIVNVKTNAVQLDELWDFVRAKHATKERLSLDDECGDVWTWCAIDADSKLILSHATGQRDEYTCTRFLRRLNNATDGSYQVTSDGLGLYTNNVPFELGSRVSFAQLVKEYKSTQVETRYSPAKIVGIEIIERFGSPDPDKISTSYSERLNLSIRMHVRRFTRLTNAHSKTYRHHSAMTSLFVCWYNFCRKNMAIRNMTPAMASGLTEHVWDLRELLEAAK